VRALVRSRAKAEPRLAGIPVEIVTGDLRDGNALSGAVRGCDAVVHLAAIAIERRGQTYEAVNTDAALALLAAARDAGVPRFVQMSQNGASSASPHRFLRSKGLAEDAVRASGIAWTVLRPSVIWGPEDEFVNVLARLVRLSPLVYPLPGGGVARFQPVAVDDVAAAVAVSLERVATIGASYDLGGPVPLSLREIATIVLRAMGASRALVSVPVAVLRPLVAIAERVLPNPPVTTGLLALLANDNVTPDNALAPTFGIEPRPFTEANVAYLRSMTARDAVRAMFSR
jgi:NADH dehydrogenase